MKHPGARARSWRVLVGCSLVALLAACTSSDDTTGTSGPDASNGSSTATNGDSNSARSASDETGPTSGSDGTDRTTGSDGSTSDSAAGGSDAGPAVASRGSACGIVDPAFCETFDEPAGNGGRTGDLDPVLWGVSRVGNMNPNQDLINDVAFTSMDGCGSSDWLPPPNDVRICDGKMFESVNDGGFVANLNTYPKQPFSFTDRTGIVTFDVSADSDGSHGAWPEFVITDKPVPGVRKSISLQIPPSAANSIGFSIDGGCGMEGMTGVGTVFMTADHVYSEPAFTTVECITKGSATALNHFEVRVSQDRMEVWGTDAGDTELKQLAVADDLGLTFSQGLVWLDDVHYNARKAIEPCACGTQWNHTFVWDNLGFDGPKTYRDVGFDVPDALVPASRSLADDEAIRLGYEVGEEPVELEVQDVRSAQEPTAAQVVLNTYSFGAVIPSLRINDGPWIDTPWPFPDDQTYSWRSISIPVPLDQLVDGTNTITFRSPGEVAIVANISLILVAGAPVP